MNSISPGLTVHVIAYLPLERDLTICQDLGSLRSFDPASEPGQLAALANELVHELIDLAEILGDLAELFQHCPEPLDE